MTLATSACTVESSGAGETSSATTDTADGTSLLPASIFQIHEPQTLADWLEAPTLDAWVKDNGAYTAADDTKPSTPRARLRAMPELERGHLYPNQLLAITNLETSLRNDKPRALLQMATGSGKGIALRHRATASRYGIARQAASGQRHRQRGSSAPDLAHVEPRSRRIDPSASAPNLAANPVPLPLTTAARARS